MFVSISVISCLHTQVCQWECTAQCKVHFMCMKAKKFSFQNPYTGKTEVSLFLKSIWFIKFAFAFRKKKKVPTTKPSSTGVHKNILPPVKMLLLEHSNTQQMQNTPKTKHTKTGFEKTNACHFYLTHTLNKQNTWKAEYSFSFKY